MFLNYFSLKSLIVELPMDWSPRMAIRLALANGTALMGHKPKYEEPFFIGGFRVQFYNEDRIAYQKPKGNCRLQLVAGTDWQMGKQRLLVVHLFLLSSDCTNGPIQEKNILNSLQKLAIWLLLGWFSIQHCFWSQKPTLKTRWLKEKDNREFTPFSLQKM